MYDKQTETTVCYSFKYGLQYYSKKNLAVRIPYPTNHFIFLVNKGCDEKKVTNILEFNHAYPEKFPFKFVCLNNKVPMWIEVVHGRNVDNDCKMTLKQKVVCAPHYLISHFHVSKELSLIKSKIGFFAFLVPAFFRQFLHRLISKIK